MYAKLQLGLLSFMGMVLILIASRSPLQSSRLLSRRAAGLRRATLPAQLVEGNETPKNESLDAQTAVLMQTIFPTPPQSRTANLNR